MSSASARDGFTLYELTPERTERVLIRLDQHGGATAAEVATALAANPSVAARWLEELADSGQVRREKVAGRWIWSRVSLNVDAALVRQEYAPRILAFLLGRREMPGAIARALGLPQDEVGETCKALMIAGELVGTPIGMAYVYALSLRETTRIDLDAVARVPVSEEARFQAELARLAPEQAIRLKRLPAAPKAAPVPKVRTTRPTVLRIPRLSTRERLAQEGEKLRAEGWWPVGELARQAGTGARSFQRWMDTHPQVTSCRVGSILWGRPELITLYHQSLLPKGATLADESPVGWLPLKEAAHKSGLRRPDLFTALASGELQAVKVGTEFLFNPAPLLLRQAAVQAQKQAEKAAAQQARQVEETQRKAAALAPRVRRPDATLLPLKRAAQKAKLPVRQVRGLVNRDRVRHEGIGLEARVDVEALRDYKANRTRPTRATPEHRKQAKKTIRKALPVREGYRIVSEAARSLGVKPMALHKWLEHHEEARNLCVKDGKYLMVPEAVLTRYVQASLPMGATFATEVPKGWLDIWQAVERLGWSYSKVYKMLAVGQLIAVQAGGKLHFDPGPVDALKRELDTQEAVPDGWVALSALAHELKLDKSSVTSWMMRRKIEIRQYRDAQRQVVNYVPVVAADAYRASRAQCPGGVKVTPEVRLAILAALPPQSGAGRRRGLQAVAERFGVSAATVKNVLKAGHATPAMGFVPQEGAA